MRAGQMRPFMSRPRYARPDELRPFAFRSEETPSTTVTADPMYAVYSNELGRVYIMYNKELDSLSEQPKKSLAAGVVLNPGNGLYHNMVMMQDGVIDGNVLSFVVEVGTPSDDTHSWITADCTGLLDTDGIQVESPVDFPVEWAPVAGAATNLTIAGFTGSWTEADYTTDGYLLDVAYDSEFTNMAPGFNGLDIEDVTSYVVADALTPGTTYWYRVRAYETEVGVLTPSNPVKFTTLPVMAASLVGDNGETAHLLGNITTGSDPITSHGFTVSETTDPDAGTSYIVEGIEAEITETIESLTPGTKYYYWSWVITAAHTSKVYSARHDFTYALAVPVKAEILYCDPVMDQIMTVVLTMSRPIYELETGSYGVAAHAQEDIWSLSTLTIDPVDPTKVVIVLDYADDALDASSLLLLTSNSKLVDANGVLVPTFTDFAMVDAISELWWNSLTKKMTVYVGLDADGMDAAGAWRIRIDAGDGYVDEYTPSGISHAGGGNVKVFTLDCGASTPVRKLGTEGVDYDGTDASFVDYSGVAFPAVTGCVTDEGIRRSTIPTGITILSRVSTVVTAQVVFNRAVSKTGDTAVWRLNYTVDSEPLDAEDSSTYTIVGGSVRPVFDVELGSNYVFNHVTFTNTSDVLQSALLHLDGRNEDVEDFSEFLVTQPG